MKRIKSKTILPLTTLVLGIIWFILGITKYGFWTEKGPGGGFFPAIISLVMILVSGIALLQGIKEKSLKYDFSTVYPILACISIILVSQIIGMILAIFLYIVGWLRYLEKYSWRFSITLAVGLLIVVYGVFVFWLQVPFPKGYIYNNFIR